MLFGAIGRRRAPVLLLLVLGVVTACSTARVFREYEYEEDLYLALDGSVTLNVNASVAALVALHGADLDPDPGARVDRDKVRAYFSGQGATASVTFSRRDSRRFVHASVQVESVEQLSEIAPFARSSYRFDRSGETFHFQHVVGPPLGGDQTPAAQWTGNEMVIFKVHLPSEIVFHNAPSGQIARGNILEWEQSLSDRLAGRPVEMEAHLERESILYTTLLLFGGTVAAAVLTLAAIVWWIARRAPGGDLTPPASPAS